MSTYTASGARRSGDEYQDLQSVEVLIEWLEDPDVYQWVRLETMEGALDDIQAQRADGSLRLLQVKFATDPSEAWGWAELTAQPAGRQGSRPSLLQKWQTSLDNARADGATVHEAALLTNRAPSHELQAVLSPDGRVAFDQVSAPQRRAICDQLRGCASAAAFFSEFRFVFRDPQPQVLESGLRYRFERLGGTREGWQSLLDAARRWINHQDQPGTGGRITLEDVRAAALWHRPPLIPQEFVVLHDYVAPEAWSQHHVEPRVRHSTERVVVVTGSPGVGKSTYLSWLVERLRRAGVPVVRHHYFLSLADTTAHRSRWETVASAVIGQLRSLYPSLVASVDQANPVPGTLRDFITAAGTARAGQDPVVVIVDGLDHVWRDIGDANELQRLFDLLLPAPGGVVVVVGTQSVDANRIPLKLQTACPLDRWIEVPALDRADVHRWLRHHEAELGTADGAAANSQQLGQLADAFAEVSGGHPLILHYTLRALDQRSRPIWPEHVRALTRMDPTSSVAGYYQTLWDEISPEGHQLLHLLAGFPWEWPHEALVRCLSEQAEPSRLEEADRAVRHLLGTRRPGLGVTAFHESLLAFVRGRPHHTSTVDSLRPRVLNWLQCDAPAYWRWRYEWQERAHQGDPEAVISEPTLDWCVEALAAGRRRDDIAALVGASGQAALAAGRLGVATERQYLDAYLTETGRADGVFWRLIWIALRMCDGRAQKREFELFLSRCTHATEDEIEAAAEVAFATGHGDICLALLRECDARWNAAVARADDFNDRFSPLERAFPTLLGATLASFQRRQFQQHVAEHGHEPAWCRSVPYAQALGRLCAVGTDTAAVREELRCLAQRPTATACQAAYEIVRIACRERFDPASWIRGTEGQQAALFRCHQAWTGPRARLSGDGPHPISFGSSGDDFVHLDERTFVVKAHAYFVYCLACAMEDIEPESAAGVRASAVKTAAFLSLLKDLAIEAAAAQRGSQPVGGAWLLDRLSTRKIPDTRRMNVDDWLIQPRVVGRVAVAIAQDVEALHFAAAGGTTLGARQVAAAIGGPWSTPDLWIAERVDQRTRMLDAGAARVLIDAEKTRLETTRAPLHERAEQYAALAQFCLLHQEPVDERRRLARLAARNLLGHGYHKDPVLFDVLGALHAVPSADRSSSRSRVRAVAPVVTIVEDITDGDESGHLKPMLARTLWELSPDALPSYLRNLQREHEHRVVETSFSDLAEVMPLETPYERGLATTLVHETALAALQERADRGDDSATRALHDALKHFGRDAIPRPAPEDESRFRASSGTAQPPSVEDHPPEQLADFARAVRAAQLYGDDHLAAWTHHWLKQAPERTLKALKTRLAEHGYPLESQTAQAVVAKASELSGPAESWGWLVAYHQAVRGWNSYSYRLERVEWIWRCVASQFRDRWLDFIRQTSTDRWDAETSAPSWGVERMARYLLVVGQDEQANAVVDAAVSWGAGLAADMALPDHGLEPFLADSPTALLLLVDRLDCPSRLVQERAIWAVAQLLATVATRQATAEALLHWHAMESLELRSCTFLLVLHLAHAAHGLPVEDCVALARRATLAPSLGADLLLRDYGESGTSLATTLRYEDAHSGPCPNTLTAAEDFEYAVKAHLDPHFLRWAKGLDNTGARFSRQWRHEADQLARSGGLSLRPNAYIDGHYRGSANDGSLAINDRLSCVLRSAYLRALNWSTGTRLVTADRAARHGRFAAIMADPTVWAVRPCNRPDWWPCGIAEDGRLDPLAGVVEEAVRHRLESGNGDATEVLVYAAGPVGRRPHLDAQLEIRACLQSALGPMVPSADHVAALSPVFCRPYPPRLLLDGQYEIDDQCHDATRAADWLFAPLAWQLNADTQDWLLPDRQGRGIIVPAGWLFPTRATIACELDQLRITADGQSAGCFRYWYDDLRERQWQGAQSRAGAELVIDRHWLAPHLERGASLCWTVVLSVAQREQYAEHFGDHRPVGAWIVGGSRVALPAAWEPASRNGRFNTR